MPYHLAQGREDTVKDAGSPAKVPGRAGYVATNALFRGIYLTPPAPAQLLARAIGMSEREVGHPAEPDWDLSALLTYADACFLKGERDRIERLLHLLL